jgi:hypothetical protein
VKILITSVDRAHCCGSNDGDTTGKLEVLFRLGLIALSAEAGLAEFGPQFGTLWRPHKSVTTISMTCGSSGCSQRTRVLKSPARADQVPLNSSVRSLTTRVPFLAS